MNHYYSPHTGEHIKTGTPSDWMLSTPVTPDHDGMFFNGTQWHDLPPPPLSQLIAEKMAEINIDFEKAMQQITNGYPSNEVSSWAKQEAEARAYQANNTAATPLIDALAASRSVNKAELVTRIIAKADLFAGISGALIGRRQKLEDSLAALPITSTTEDVALISW